MFVPGRHTGNLAQVTAIRALARDEEAVKHGAVVTAVVEAIDEAFVLPGFPGLRAPDDALVQIGDAHAVVLIQQAKTSWSCVLVM